MTSDRPYRSAIPVAQAMSELQEAEGSQFDPAVVETFVRLAHSGRIRACEQLTA